MLQLHGGFRVRVKVSVRVLFRQTLDEWMGPKVHFFPLLYEQTQINACFKNVFMLGCY